MSSFAVRELAEATRRADNLALLGELCRTTTSRPPRSSQTSVVAASGDDRPRRVAAILGLLNDGDARRSLATETVGIPHLADSEVSHGLRTQVLAAA